MRQPNAVTLLASKPSKALRACPHAGAPGHHPTAHLLPAQSPRPSPNPTASHITQVRGLQPRIPGVWRGAAFTPEAPRAPRSGAVHGAHKLVAELRELGGHLGRVQRRAAAGHRACLPARHRRVGRVHRLQMAQLGFRAYFDGLPQRPPSPPLRRWPRPPFAREMVQKCRCLGSTGHPSLPPREAA